MRKLLKYLLLGFCALFLAGNATAAIAAADQVGEDTALQGKIIQSFCNSLGFNVLEEKDSSFVYADSLLDILELHEQFDSYFELSRIIIKSQILKGKMGMAIAHSDRMYSKARVLKDVLGMALSLNAIGEIYTAIGREREAGDAYERSLALFEEYGGGETMKKLYISTMEKKAQLLEKMGRKEEAFTLYNTIYSYINSKFKANYPKEIDQLCARFEADQLTYQITQDRNRSLRYYTIAIGGCALVLALFIFLSWRKIFRLKQSKQKMEEMNRKAENAIRKKNLFLSNMSHEVRTPLNAIVGFSTLMASEEIEVDEVSRKEYCEIIRINSYQLLKLINDIIDFSDFDEDNISMTIKGQDAVKICREVIETVAASYKLQVELRFDTSLTSLMIDTDDSRLRQVLINLLVNATKFTTQGSIVLRLERSIDDADMALFSVTDTGCGIPLEKQKLIFERFEKLNDFVQGTGLGLSICLLILKRLKGKIWIDDKYTEGARFCFLHPLKSESKLI